MKRKTRLIHGGNTRSFNTFYASPVFRGTMQLTKQKLNSLFIHNDLAITRGMFVGYLARHRVRSAMLHRYNEEYTGCLTNN